MVEQPNFIRQGARRLLSTLLPRRAFLTKGKPQSGAIFITFDDGPHPDYTPRLLDVLAETGAQATFFVVGAEAEKYPDIVRRMAAEGHSVGDHTWSHTDIRKLAKSNFLDELRRSSDLLSELTGQPKRLFRPPHGKLGVSQFLTLLRHGYTIALWNVDSRDYACESHIEVQGKLSHWQVQVGDILLLHDRLDHVHRSTAWVVERARNAMPQLLFKGL